VRYIVNILFLLGFALNLSGQNLVLNGGFEDLISCPLAQGGAPNSYCYNWYSPTKSTPDYFNTCASGWVDVPNNMCGYQNPRTENGYGGFASSPFPQGGCEYLTGKLSTPLNSNKTYCLSFYINLADRQAFAYDRIGVYFSSDSIHYETYFVLPVTPQIETQEWVFYTDTVNWMPVTLEYTAQGGERYFTIGNFRDETQTHFITLDSNQTFSYAYYYIDDVSLVCCDADSCEIEPPIIPLTIPNVFTPNNDGVNDVFKIENLVPNSSLTIYNRWGSAVYKSTNYQNNWDGDNCSDGVYYYILNTANGKQYKGTVTILR
jgi:gliding motility-associated-like protein